MCVMCVMRVVIRPTSYAWRVVGCMMGSTALVVRVMGVVHLMGLMGMADLMGMVGMIGMMGMMGMML